MFDARQHFTRRLLGEALRGLSGYPTLTRLCLESYEQEEHLLFSAFEETGQLPDQETCEKLLVCAAQIVDPLPEVPAPAATRLRAEAERHVPAIISQSLERNSRYFHEAREKPERRPHLAAEKALRDTKDQFKQQRQARLMPTLGEQQAVQQTIRQPEQQHRRRRDLFTAEDDIMQRHNDLINALEQCLTHRTTTKQLLTIRWSVA